MSPELKEILFICLGLAVGVYQYFIKRSVDKIQSSGDQIIRLETKVEQYGKDIDSFKKALDDFKSNQIETGKLRTLTDSQGQDIRQIKEDVKKISDNTHTLTGKIGAFDQWGREIKDLLANIGKNK